MSANRNSGKTGKFNSNPAQRGSGNGTSSSASESSQTGASTTGGSGTSS